MTRKMGQIVIRIIAHDLYVQLIFADRFVLLALPLNGDPLWSFLKMLPVFVIQLVAPSSFGL